MFMLPFFDPSLKLGCAQNKLINCRGMRFNWVADVHVYLSLICHINNNDPAKLW